MNEDKQNLEQRLAALEEFLRFDERLEAVETAVKEKSATRNKIWWRDAKTVTILGTLIAAVLPLLTVINNVFTSYRESRRLFVEQQEKVRQLYLDRVFKPGVGQVEQQRILGLLAELSSDPELQKWAQKELKTTTEEVESLRKQKEAAENRLKDAEAELKSSRKEVTEERKQRYMAEKTAGEAKNELRMINARLESNGSVESRVGLGGDDSEGPQGCLIDFTSMPYGATVDIKSGDPVPKGVVHYKFRTPATGVVAKSAYQYFAEFRKEGYRTVGVPFTASFDHCDRIGLVSLPELPNR